MGNKVIILNSHYLYLKSELQTFWLLFYFFYVSKFQNESAVPTGLKFASEVNLEF